MKRLATALVAAALAVAPVTACQLIGGIGEIDLAPGDASLLGDASGDSPGSDADGRVTPRDGGDAGAGDGARGAAPCVLEGGACLGPGEVTGGVNGGTQQFCDNGVLTPCGQAMQACCPGSGDGRNESPAYCTGGLGCANGLCVPCGAAGEPCCADGPNLPCNNQGCCDPSGICVGQQQTCSNGQACENQVCGGANGGNCGHMGYPCCAGSVCEPQRACVMGTCQRCGDQNSPCCPGPGSTGTCPRQPGIVCVGGTCTPCGSAGQPCCAGDQCSGSLLCDPSTGTCGNVGGCGTCGAMGQACCPSSSCVPGDCCDPGPGTCVADGGKCQSGYLCIAGSCACGTEGHSCCNNQSACPTGGCCDPMTTLCHASGNDCMPGVTVCSNGACTACGSAGQPCCAGGACPNDVNGCTGGRCP